MALSVRCLKAFSHVRARPATVSREWANGFRECRSPSGEMAGARENTLNQPVKLLIVGRPRESAGLKCNERMALSVRCLKAFSHVRARPATVSREWANGMRERRSPSGEWAGAREKYLKSTCKVIDCGQAKGKCRNAGKLSETRWC
jgi:hypothetical protein